MKQNSYLIFLTTFFFSLLLIAIFVTMAWASATTSSSSFDVSLSVSCTSNACDSGGGGGGGEGGKKIPGCMDPLANNYNVSATVSNNSCTYDEEPVCTDPLATNYYNPISKQSNKQYNKQSNKQSNKQQSESIDDPCIYVIPNVTNFQASFDLATKQVSLTWTKPNFPALASIRIVRSTISVPISPDEGVIVYEGTGTSFIDSGLELRIRYYYTAFVRSTTGEYSSGAVTSAIGVFDPKDELPPPIITPVLPNDSNDPFSVLPIATTKDPVLEKIILANFQLRQTGEITKYFSAGSVVTVNGNKDLVLAIDSSSFPKVLKTIGVVISDPSNQGRSFSFIMRLSPDGSTYTASLGSFKRNGNFPITIYIINYKNQTVKKIEGKLAVAGVSLLTSSSLTEKISAVAQPVAVAAGLVVGLSQFAFWGMNINS
ncbi:MAG: hypothetical protein COX02_00745, partial [Candidatus Vogelbacteria bacterium CG22_combo_CG10-13_8_21_14_all_37_9]